jgi:hypothetical protein
MVFNATFNNVSVISWRSLLLEQETGVCLCRLLVATRRVILIEQELLTLPEKLSLHPPFDLKLIMQSVPIIYPVGSWLGHVPVYRRSPYYYRSIHYIR